ncbi:MAG: hypothetical protein Q8P41_05090 [Pseudomonadota bacterium]|nr:hypothetical protein [Pseudomonadota bacterium]
MCGDEPAAGVEEAADGIPPAILAESITAAIEAYHTGACPEDAEEGDLVAIQAIGICWTLQARLGATCAEIDPAAAQACLASLRFATCEDIYWDGYRNGTWSPECDAVCS